MNDARRHYAWISLGIALVASGILLGGSEAAFTLLLVTGGIVLLLVELFVLPGFGVAGVLGALLLVVAASMMLFSGDLGTADFGGLTLAGAGAVFLGRHISSLPAIKKLIRPKPRSSDVAFPERHPVAAQPGNIGVVLTPLRLGGKARFGGQTVEVQSETEFVDVGTRVQVVEATGLTVVVRPLLDDDTSIRTDAEPRRASR